MAGLIVVAGCSGTVLVAILILAAVAVRRTGRVAPGAGVIAIWSTQLWRSKALVMGVSVGALSSTVAAVSFWLFHSRDASSSLLLSVGSVVGAMILGAIWHWGLERGSLWLELVGIRKVWSLTDKSKPSVSRSVARYALLNSAFDLAAPGAIVGLGGIVAISLQGGPQGTDPAVVLLAVLAGYLLAAGVSGVHDAGLLRTLLPTSHEGEKPGFPALEVARNARLDHVTIRSIAHVTIPFVSAVGIVGSRFALAAGEPSETRNELLVIVPLLLCLAQVAALAGMIAARPEGTESMRPGLLRGLVVGLVLFLGAGLGATLWLLGDDWFRAYIPLGLGDVLATLTIVASTRRDSKLGARFTPMVLSLVSFLGLFDLVVDPLLWKHAGHHLSAMLLLVGFAAPATLWIYGLRAGQLVERAKQLAAGADGDAGASALERELDRLARSPGFCPRGTYPSVVFLAAGLLYVVALFTVPGKNPSWASGPALLAGLIGGLGTVAMFRGLLRAHADRVGGAVEQVVARIRGGARDGSRSRVHASAATAVAKLVGRVDMAVVAPLLGVVIAVMVAAVGGEASSSRAVGGLLQGFAIGLGLSVTAAVIGWEPEGPGLESRLSHKQTIDAPDKMEHNNRESVAYGDSCGSPEGRVDGLALQGIASAILTIVAALSMFLF